MPLNKYFYVFVTKKCCSLSIVSTALDSSRCCCTTCAFDSSCPVTKVADTKTNRMSFAESFGDPLQQKIPETHNFLENIIYQSNQKQCGSLGLELAAVLFKNPLSANLEELVVL